MCECRLLPITTDFYPDEKDLKDVKSYFRSETFLQKPKNKVTLFSTQRRYFEEFLCLRLT